MKWIGKYDGYPKAFSFTLCYVLPVNHPDSSYTLVYAIDYIEDLMFGDFYKNIMMYYYDRPKNSRSMTLNAWVSKLKKLRYDMYLDDMKKYHTLSNRSK